MPCRQIDHHGRRLGSRPLRIVSPPDDGPVSLLVDTIDGVVEPSPDCYEDPPETTQTNVRNFLTHVCKLDGRLLHVLDPERLIDITPN